MTERTVCRCATGAGRGGDVERGRGSEGGGLEEQSRPRRTARRAVQTVPARAVDIAVAVASHQQQGFGGSATGRKRPREEFH